MAISIQEPRECYSGPALRYIPSSGNTKLEIFFSWWGILPFFSSVPITIFVITRQRDLEFWQIAWRNWESLFLITVLDWAVPKVLWNTAVGSQQEAQPSSASKTQAFLPILRFQNFLILQLKILLQLLHLFKAIFFFLLLLGPHEGPNPCSVLLHAEFAWETGRRKLKDVV